MTSAAHVNTGIWGEHCFEFVDACPFCHSKDRSVEILGAEDWFFHCVPGSFDFARCKACASLWQERRLASGHLARAYSSYYTHQPAAAADVASGIRNWLRGLYVKQRFAGSNTLEAQIGAALYRGLARNRNDCDAIYRFAPPAPARLLDYGCGSGDYLRRMRDLGHDVTGVDFDPAAIRACRANGVAAHTPDEAETQDWSEAFDAITLSHVIEHVPDPRAVLHKLRGYLKPGGFIYIEVPNAQAAGLSVFGRYWRGLEAPRHLSLPSRKGLEIALEMAGLRIERQVVRASIRHWLWIETLQAVPSGEKAEFEALALADHPQTAANTEFLTLIARADSAPPPCKG